MFLLAFVAAVLGYVALVERLRFRRRDSLTSKYPYRDRQSFARMTLEDAFEIMSPLAELEFPTTFSTSIFFALFKVSPKSSALLKVCREIVT